MTITRDQSRDTGMAMVLLLLIAYLKFGSGALLAAALVLHVVDMVAPQVFRPLVPLWFGLAHLLGAVSSRILLSLVFGLVVTPIGVLRRALGKDSLRLRAFRAGDESVMVVRNHTFTSGDLENPY
jgi:Saxitoxin biosynthesis operon protein SxtJ